MNAKYVFVSGGVASSLGKGIISASLAKLLQARGLRVTIQKFDPYINIDPGTLNPYEHGECYVTEDGAETDLDLGHYERFLGIHTSKANNVTTGKIYHTVISREREGAYLGKTVQIVPHITDEIKRRMLLLGKSGNYDVVITEIGGTVGDMESQPFVEAVRQLQWELPEEDCVTIHLTLVPYLKAAKELKTKPTQHSVQMLQQSGVQPDIIVCRTKLFNPKYETDIALVGKYVELQDAYKSILESFVHAGAANECKVNVHTVHSEFLNEQNVEEKLGNMDAILVAPGFGERGLEGKIIATKYAREHNVPFFGICLGMQMCVVEFARDVLGLKDAVSTEVNPATSTPIIDLMEDQKSTTIKGGTMRLGAYDCKLEKGSLAYSIYGKELISERHRHRYEFNNEYLPMVEKAGMKASGRNPETGLVEIVELPSHPFFIGVQFHPELKSTPERPQPIFVAFVKAAMKYRAEHHKDEKKD